MTWFFRHQFEVWHESSKQEVSSEVPHEKVIKTTITGPYFVSIEKYTKVVIEIQKIERIDVKTRVTSWNTSGQLFEQLIFWVVTWRVSIAIMFIN